MTPAEREENQRMIVCNQVMKYILDKIDKEEKQAAKKRKREESVEQKRSKQNATKLSALLFKHKEQLKAEILKKESAPGQGSPDRSAGRAEERPEN